MVGLRKTIKSYDEVLLDCAKSIEDEETPDSIFKVDDQVEGIILEKSKSWKEPGPDGMHAFWWGVF